MTSESLVGPLPDEWEVLSLGEACSRQGGGIQTGPFGSQLHAADYVLDGIPSVMPENIGENRIVVAGIARIRLADAERLSRYRLKTDDIVYGRRGDVGRRSLVRETEDGWLCGTGCLRVRLGDGQLAPGYLSYYLGHPAVRGWILQHSVGATMPNLNTAILSSVPIVVPPHDYQLRVASVLGALDDKIDVNQRIAETLEAIARTLFQSWFVDFDPVRGTATVPEDIRRLFPDRLVDSRIGPVPEGWEVASFGDHVENETSQVDPGRIAGDTPYIGLEHMPRGRVTLAQWGTASGLESGKRAFKKADVLFGKLRPYFHKVGVAPLDGVCSTDILVLRPREPTRAAWALMVASSDAFVDRANAASTGTRMPRASWKDMAAFPVVAPPPHLLGAFQAVAGPILSLIDVTVHENRTLAELRDTLLPKLISGEIRLRNAS